MEGLLKGLTDFTDLRKRGDDFNSLSSKQSHGNGGIDLDMESNQNLIKSFRQLREKLKSSQKENTNLRQQIKGMQVQILQLHQSENNLRSINMQLKEKSSQIQQGNDQLKKRLIIMKQSLTQKASLQQQIQFMKGNLLQYQMKCQKLQDQKKKLIQISIEDKLHLEDKLNKVLFRSNSDGKYISQMEGDLSKAKETILKLQNQIKKVEIKYDEEIFNKKWSKDNFEKQHFQNHIKELEQEISDLKSKVKKEKEKRSDLQKRVIQLEEVAGLWNVKAEAFEGEADMMNKKVKKMERRVSQAKSSATKLASEKITWEQKFIKTVYICEELINRVKRELVGDMVQLAKTCQFRINKLKEGKDSDILRPSIGKQHFGTAKKSQKLLKSNRKSTQKQIWGSTKYTNNQILPLQYQGKGILAQSQNNNQQKLQKTKTVGQNSFFDKSNQQNDKSLSRQCDLMQLKIRKQRDEMQKKLKERMLYRKIQVSGSPDKSKLRQDYLKLIFQK